MLWMILSFLTAGRILFASMGFLSGPEAYLMLCGQRLDWCFVEGPAGVPSLIRLSTSLGGCGPFGVRILSPCFLLLSSFVLWRLVSSLRGKRVAFWSVVAFNLLPIVNTAALVMDGTMIAATLWMITLAWSWLLIKSIKPSLASWVIYGLLLAVTTQVSYCVGWLLLVVIVIMVVERSKIDWLALGIALFLLAASWVGPLWWNIDHEWLQWSQITWGSVWSYQLPPWSFTPVSSSLFWSWFLLLFPLFFLSVACFIFSCEKKAKKKNLAFAVLLVVPFLFCIVGIGHNRPSCGLQLLLWAMLLPGIVDFFLTTNWRKISGLLVLCATGFFSLFVILDIMPLVDTQTNNELVWSIPSRTGVKGVQKLAVELLRLRVLQTGSNTSPSAPPFIIAETPQLASLLGALLPIHYLELAGAPSVFTPESPSFSSQFQLWPHYADAVASGIVDPLYTEEPMTSPFIGHDAFYVTSELTEDLPETISGAFSQVTPISEVTLQEGKRSEKLMIYECKNYQMMSL